MKFKFNTNVVGTNMDTIYETTREEGNVLYFINDNGNERFISKEAGFADFVDEAPQEQDRKRFQRNLTIMIENGYTMHELVTMALANSIDLNDLNEWSELMESEREAWDE